MENAPLVAAVVAIVMTLVELVKALVGKVMRLIGNDKSALSNKEHEALIKLLEMHCHYDSDGTPLWYVPRSWASLQEKIVEICQDIAKTQDLIANTMDRLERRLEQYHND